jgi:chromosome partitioning protein
MNNTTHTKVIAVANPKGGVGRTTLAMNLAGALANAGYSVRVVDGDPMQTAMHWSAVGRHFPATVVAAANFDREAMMQEGADVVIVDCPNSRTLEFSRAALAASDLTLVPVRPSKLDIWATATFLSDVQDVASTARLQLVANSVEQTPLDAELLNEIKRLPYPMLATLQSDPAFDDAATRGSSVDVVCDDDHPAKLELLALMGEVCGLLGLRPTSART